MKAGYLLLLVTFVTIKSQAQTASPKDSVIKGGSTIEVIQSYKPEVKQAPKPELAPGLPPTDTAHPAFTYEVPQQTLNYTYSSVPLRPLALGKDTAAASLANYIKLGAGNLSTLYLDAGIGSLRGKNYETAIHLHHLSQKGAIGFQQSSLSGIEADGTLHHDNKIWHAFADVERDQYNYYGYNHDLYQYDKDSTRQTYTLARAGIDMQNELSGKFNYHPSINASVYTDRYSTTETTLGINLPITYSIDSFLQLSLAFNGLFSGLKNTGNTYGNNIAQLIPGISYHKNDLYIKAYLAPTIGKGGNSYLLPDITASYNIPGSFYSIYAGWQAALRQNTFEQLSTDNPYIADRYAIGQTRKDEVFIGLQGNTGEHLSFHIRASWWQYSNLPLFLNDTANERVFRILYDDRLNALSLQFGIRYQVADIFALGADASFYNYYNGTQAHAWHEPAAKVKGDLLFRPFPKLAITAYLALLDGIYALDVNEQAVKLKPIADLGAGAEYNILSNLSAFLQLTNLLNNKYERWLGYQVYGLNIYGGIRFKF